MRAKGKPSPCEGIAHDLQIGQGCWVLGMKLPIEQEIAIGRYLVIDQLDQIAKVDALIADDKRMR